MSEKAPSDQSSQAKGFARVLSSLQGLQQRLDEFSVEEVIRAHDRALDLIRQLGALHARLAMMKQFKQVSADVKDTVSTAPEINFETIESDHDGLEKHPRLRAVVQAGKLIEKHGLLRVPQSSPKTPGIHLAPVPTSLTCLAGNATDAPLGHSLDSRADMAAKAKTRMESGIQLTVVDTAADASSSGSGFILMDSAGGPTGRGGQSSAAHLQRSPANGPRRVPEDNQARTKLSKATPTGNFDERLLKELIDTYGEFAVSDRSPSTRFASPETPLAPELARELADTGELAPLEEPTRLDAGAPMAPAEHAPAAPEPAFVMSISGGQLALPKPDASPAFEAAAPSFKARGEIDQQLKNLIRDYGEVDLYSHRTSINTKTKAIVAAALLALALGGFYLLRAPSSPPQIPNEAAAVTEPSTASKNAMDHSAAQK